MRDFTTEFQNFIDDMLDGIIEKMVEYNLKYSHLDVKIDTLKKPSISGLIFISNKLSSHITNSKAPGVARS